MSTLLINISLLLFHGLTFVWILIFQCAKKPAADDKKATKSEMKQASSYTKSSAPPNPGLSEAGAGTSQVSNVGQGANSFAQQTGNQQSTMPPTSNMTQTQQSQAGTQQSQAISSKQPTVTEQDDGGYDNLNPSSKPIESVK